jgi:proteasome beta subunit
MSTIVGVRCRDGVVLAGDRVLVRDDRIESRNRQHVFDVDHSDGVGAAAVGSDVDRFVDRLENELRSYDIDEGDVSVDALERMASDVASETGTEALVATRDAEGRAALRSISADGSTLSDSPAVFGSGASLALGSLEAADLDSLSLPDAEDLVRETFESVAERDPGTGDEVDVWTLADGDGEGHDEDRGES